MMSEKRMWRARLFSPPLSPHTPFLYDTALYPPPFTRDHSPPGPVLHTLLLPFPRFHGDRDRPRAGRDGQRRRRR